MPDLPDHTYANQEEFYEKCDACECSVALPHYTSSRQKLCTDCYADYMDRKYDWLMDK